eukprot:1371813-Pleurochrysis_carterae.AAC.1
MAPASLSRRSRMNQRIESQEQGKVTRRRRPKRFSCKELEEKAGRDRPEPLCTCPATSVGKAGARCAAHRWAADAAEMVPRCWIVRMSGGRSLPRRTNLNLDVYAEAYKRCFNSLEHEIRVQMDARTDSRMRMPTCALPSVCWHRLKRARTNERAHGCNFSI